MSNVITGEQVSDEYYVQTFGQELVGGLLDITRGVTEQEVTFDLTEEPATPSVLLDVVAELPPELQLDKPFNTAILRRYNNADGGMPIETYTWRNELERFNGWTA